MNIFVLDMNVEKCAEYHNDSHVRKMIIESTQLLSNAHWAVNDSGIYKKAFFNHPCSIWARESIQNYLWLCQLAHALCKEFEYRYDKVHACHEKIHWLMDNIPLLPDIGMTPFVQAMPEYCRCENAVDAYRKYYQEEKKHLAKWKNRDIPYWIRVDKI